MRPRHTPHAIICDGEYVLARYAVLRGLRKGQCHLCKEEVYLCSNRWGVGPYYAHCPRRVRHRHEAPTSESGIHQLWCRNTTDTVNRWRLLGMPLSVGYSCCCGRRHRVNLLDGVVEVTTNRVYALPGDLGVVRPDVGLQDSTSLRVVLEGVRGHPLQQGTLDVYRNAGAIVLELGVAVALIPWPRSPYKTEAGYYLARPWPADKALAAMMCRLHWTEPSCPRREADSHPLRYSHFELVQDRARRVRRFEDARTR